MAMQIREPVLLTGAGFTRNFGGFLANQMWDKVFNPRAGAALSVLGQSPERQL